MPEGQPRKPGLSPSPVLLALSVVILAVVVVGAITFLTTGLTAPTTVQTGALAESNKAQSNLVAKQTAVIVETATTRDDEANMVNRVDMLAVDQFRENETIRDWVYRTGRLMDNTNKSRTLDVQKNLFSPNEHACQYCDFRASCLLEEDKLVRRKRLQWDAFYAYYAHLLDPRPTFAIGDAIADRQLIGTVGCTGNCSGTHIHTELRDLE